MSSQIRVLPTEVVHLMAAGEVIDSPAAVVRELVENALDAGATRITVSLWPDLWQIRVADNGMGMSLADLQQAATPHSTSKIHQRSDLWQIQSLGFRGEALHSLAQLCQLEIVSRRAATPVWQSVTSPGDCSSGYWVKYDHAGQPSQIEPVAIAPGTVVTVSHLFSDWLPRRQALPSSAQQLRTIQLTIHHLALCHPQITWQVEQNDRPWFSIWAGATAKLILPQLLSEIQAADLCELTLSLPTAVQSLEVPLATLSLLLGLPDRCHRHRPDWVRVAINRRLVKLPELEQTILSAFRRTLPRDRHPVCFLHLHLPPDQVDWHRHPAKTEIHLQDIHYWQKQTTDAIEHALQLNAPGLAASPHQKRVQQVLKTAESAAIYSTARAVEGQSHLPPSPSSLSPSSPYLVKAVAQVHNRYILAEHATGVWLIEQHIAHERVLYEQLSDRWQLVALETPLLLASLTPRQVEQLQRLGLDIETFGNHLWVVRTAPAPLAERSDCPDALLELSWGGDLEAALVATACRVAIRNGVPLTLPEMQTLLDQWQATRHPRTCPHGRPICLSLEESSLARFFRRHWVIGKSHGI